MLSTWTRFGIVLIAALATLASAGKSNKRTVGTDQVSAPPPPMAMSPDTALGLWKSSFGAVKIERDDTVGSTGVMGVWVYQRGPEEVVGFFKGALNGNVLEFSWQEPGVPAALTGSGYLVFDPGGVRFNGKWWTASRDRQGDWSGWRTVQPQTDQPSTFSNTAPDDPAVLPADTYGGGYGGAGYGGTTYGGTYGGSPTSPPPPPPSTGPSPGPM
jgi:hypothetical protein